MKNQKGITLISLVITVIVLVILSAVGMYLTLGDNGIVNRAQQAKDETLKEAATEKMNLKITSKQIEMYTQEQRMPTLQEFSDELCEDNEIEYVELASKNVASLDKIEVGEAESIFTKLKAYPYEFEINSSLQLASIDGVQVATSDTVTITKKEYEILKNNFNYSQEELEIGKWINGETLYKKTFIITNFSNNINIGIDRTKIIDIKGYHMELNGNATNVPYVPATNDMSIYGNYYKTYFINSNNEFVPQFGSSVAAGTLYLTIEYIH